MLILKHTFVTNIENNFSSFSFFSNLYIVMGTRTLLFSPYSVEVGVVCVYIHPTSSFAMREIEGSIL